MKINKLFLKISHYFGYRLDEEHVDDVMVNLATCYPDQEIYDIFINKKSNWEETKNR